MGSIMSTSDATLKDYKQRLLRVLVHIQQHLDDSLGLGELAAIACFSPHHFHRVFKGMVGETVMGHVRRLRLERAAGELKLGHRSVTDIAFQAGYETHEAFSRAFKAKYGIAPILFRARPRLSVADQAPSGVHYMEGEPLSDFRTRRAAKRLNVV